MKNLGIGYTNYIDETSSVASLARQLLLGIDRKSEMTTVPTIHLITVLEEFISIGFGVNREDVRKMATSIGAAFVSAEAAQRDRAIGRGDEQ